MDEFRLDNGPGPPAFRLWPRPGSVQSDVQESKIRESVVKISATMRYPDLVRPWAKQSPREASGTGVVIEGKRILTNAHVVLYASQLFVETSQSGDKRAATVESVSPGMDLAVLKLEDESFFEAAAAARTPTACPRSRTASWSTATPRGEQPVDHQGDRLADRVRAL